jgi:voltage-gated potassium channel
VLSPYLIGARRIAAAATQPNVVEFLDVAMQGDEMSLAMEEVMVSEISPVAGQTLADSGIRQHSGAVIVAIKDSRGNLNSNPSPGTVIHSGDILIAVGAVRELESLAQLAGKAIVE